MIGINLRQVTLDGQVAQLLYDETLQVTWQLTTGGVERLNTTTPPEGDYTLIGVGDLINVRTPSTPLGNRTYIYYSNAFVLVRQLLSPETFGVEFQDSVGAWMSQCFTEALCNDHRERNLRFLEEAMQLTQACGMERDDVHALVDYVFDRESRPMRQKLGGAQITLAALATAHGTDMIDAAVTELERVYAEVDAVRDHHSQKPSAVTSRC